MKTQKKIIGKCIKLLSLTLTLLVASLLYSCGIFSNEPDHVHEFYDNYVEETCTEDGYLSQRCDCGEEYIIDNYYRRGHDTRFDEYVEPTCTTPGYDLYRCHCGYVEKTERISALGHFHDYNYTEEWTYSTCTEDGYLYGICECGYRELWETYKADGHHYSEEVVSPTCTEGGYSVFTCYCGDSYVDNYTEPAHYGTVYEGKDATCTESGWSEYIICDICDYNGFAEIAALGHDFSDCYYIAPTCTDNGRMTGPCRNCGEMFDEPVPATGHTYSDLVDTGDICNNVPTSFIYCTTCDVVIFSIGHNYKVSVTQATCTEDGKTDYTCIRCEDTYTVTREAVGHIGGEWTTVTEATCTAEGEEICRCMICDEVLATQTIAPTSHNYTSSEIGAKIYYVCKVCEDVKTVDKVNNSISLGGGSSGGGNTTLGPKELFTITFVPNNGETISPLTIVKDEVVELPIPEKEGFTFGGWFYTEDFSLPCVPEEIDKSVTLYAFWIANDATVAKDKNSIITGVDTSFTFGVISDVALYNSNIGNYLSVTDRDGNKVNVYIESTDGNIYNIASDDYSPAQTYIATLNEGVSFVDFAGSEFWFKIASDEYMSIVYRDEVVLISETDVYGTYTQGETLFLVLAEDLLDKDDIAVIYGEYEFEILYSFRVVSQIPINKIYIYEITDADYDSVFETYKANLVDNIDASQIELSVTIKEDIIAAVEESPLYAQFVQTAKIFGDNSNGKYKLVEIGMEEPPIHMRKEGLVINIKVKAVYEKDTIVGIGVIQTDRFEVILDIKHTTNFISEAEFEGIDNYSFILGLDSTLSIEIYVSSDLDHLEKQKSFTDLFKQVKTTGIFEQAEYKDYKFEPKQDPTERSITIGRISTPGFIRFYIDIEVGFRFEATGTIGAQLLVNNRTRYGIQNSPETGYRFISSNYSDSMTGAYIIGRVEVAAFIRVEVGVIFAGIARLYVEAECGPSFQMGGIFHAFGSSTAMEDESVIGGFIRLGAIAKVKINFTVSLCTIIGNIDFYEVEIWKLEKEWWWFEVGSAEVPLYFSVRDEVVNTSIKCKNKIRLDEIIDHFVVFHDLDESEKYEVKVEEKDCKYYLIGTDENKYGKIVVEKEGDKDIYYLVVDDFAGTKSFEISVVCGNISKTATINVAMSHTVYSVSVSSSVCSPGKTINYYRCSRCHDYFYADDYGYLQWIDELPTRYESAHQMEKLTVPAECKANGGEDFDYYHCVSCGKLFSDSMGYISISESSLDDKKGEHSFTNGVCACGKLESDCVKYSVTLDPNGGTCITDWTVTYGEEYGDIPTPIWEDDDFTTHKFLGWYTDDGELITSSTNVGAVGDHTLTAKWDITYYYGIVLYTCYDKIYMDTDKYNVILCPIDESITLTANNLPDWNGNNLSYWAWGYYDTEDPYEVYSTELTFGANTFKHRDVVYIVGIVECFTTGTMITMADGTERPIEDLQVGDMVLTRNFVTGEFEAAPISLYWYHGTSTFNVLNLSFSDGTVVRVINDHGFFDADLNKFVYINEKNYTDYLGHRFIKFDGDGSYGTVIFEGMEVTTEKTGSYSLRTAINDNAIAEGMLTLTPEDIPGMLTYFEVGEDLKYDEEKMNADIEKYGLYTYEEWADYVSYEEFVALNGQYFKILVGKGILTEEDILSLIAGMRV